MGSARRRCGALAISAALVGVLAVPLAAGAATPESTPLTFGRNEFGQLGDGSSSTLVRATPGPVDGLGDVVDIGGGREHVIALRSDGTVVTWGSDFYGQLGNGAGDTSNHNTPVSVAGLTNIVDVDDGHYHSIALRSDGTAWVWGFGSLGQLGNGSTTVRVHVPVQFGTLSNVERVFGGRDMTFALLDDGTVWCAGSNANGECGEGATEPKTTSPIEIEGLANVVDMAGGRNHGVALKANGTVWTWGLNVDGQLGDGTRVSHADPRQVAGLPEIVDVGAGADHSVAVTATGDVYTWGWGARGQLGLGDENDRLVPTKVMGISNAAISEAGRDHTLIITTTGHLVTWGENAFQQTGNTTADEVLTPFDVPNLDNVVAAAGGQAYSVVLQANDAPPVPVFTDGFDSGLSDWTGGANFALDQSRFPASGSAPSLRAALVSARAAATHVNLPTQVGPGACALAEVRLESLSTATSLLRLRAGDGSSIARLVLTKARKLRVRADGGGLVRTSGTVVPLGQWHQLGVCAIRDSGSADEVALTYDGSEVGRWTLDNGNAFVGQVQIGSPAKVTATFNLDDVEVTTP
jgi:alpha-tubulin suppressor-like RCC1 family protein